VQVDGRDLGDFAVAAPPSGEHPRGVVAAFLTSADTAISLVAVDVESGRSIAYHLVGYGADTDTVRIARTRRGVVVAHQSKIALELHWYTDGTVDADTRSLPKLAYKDHQELRGFATFDDRIVLATGGTGRRRSGSSTRRAACSRATRAMEDRSIPGTRISFAWAIASWRRTSSRRTLACRSAGDACTVRRGGVRSPCLVGSWSRGWGGSTSRAPAAPTRPRSTRSTRTFQPTGLTPPATYLAEVTPCAGLTGTYRRHSEELAGQLIVSTGSCCGDEAVGGLFVCKPPSHGP